MDSMDGQARREEILRRLGEGSAPVSAASLARTLGVSRQVIVGDVALLRAAGHPISATPRGYVKERAPGLTRTLACIHPPQGMEAELNALVDTGCEVVDVVVEHPLYGQLTGPLQLSSRYEVRQFLDRCGRADAQPLSNLTEGIHLHTLSCPGEDAFRQVLRALEDLGILLTDRA